MDFAPGNMVRARGRDWIVQSGSDDHLLCLRPLTGGSDETAYLIPALEEVKASTFELPDAELVSNLEDSSLFRESVMLRLRDSAGPLRSLGHIAVEPRSYQLTPLLMALRMNTVRLLIADDVGIGKTIEAGLIAREYLDRFEIQRLSVLCPPHLVDQWVTELNEHFNLNAVALTSSSAYTLEKKVPIGMNLTEYYPITVVSLDYIKDPKRRDNYILSAPEFIIIDEAHTCTDKSGKNSQLRFNLVYELSKDTSRHMVMLTATPHSGDSDAFGKLLSLIDPRFEVLGSSDSTQYRELRLELGEHFVQRQRKDIEKYQDSPNFADRLRNEYSYAFNVKWKDFFEDVREYCAELGSKYEREGNKTIWYAILALYRSIASSPDSAINALQNRLGNVEGEYDEDSMDNLLDSSSSDSASDSDISDIFAHSRKIRELLEEAKSLKDEVDPKYDLLLNVLKKEYLKKGEEYRPIIFCKYIATAKYVAEKLKKSLNSKTYTVEVITGEQSPEERQMKVLSLGDAEYPILVATDCLSEGINLQDYFNGVIHYDLAWNPTRHEQREGRVDRFGQNSPSVKCAMIYGNDNPVDGFILNVILRKANKIRDSLGVMVPVPDDDKAIQSALIQATLLKRHQDSYGQLFFDFGDIDEVETMLNKPWENASEKAKANRTIFAQRSIHADEVYSVLKKEQQILGTDDDVEKFVVGILSRLNASPEKIQGGYKLNLANLPAEVKQLKDQINDAGINSSMKVSFKFPAPMGYKYIHRTHPLVEILASYVFEYNMENKGQALHFNLGSRCSVTETKDVSGYTVLFLIRLRMQILTRRQGEEKTSVAEESVLLEYKKRELRVIDNDLYKKYLEVTPSSNLSPSFIQRKLQKALEEYSGLEERIGEIALECSEHLKTENDAVRQTFGKGNIGQLSVKPCMPVDLLGVYILVPAEEE